MPFLVSSSCLYRCMWGFVKSKQNEAPEEDNLPWSEKGGIYLGPKQHIDRTLQPFDIGNLWPSQQPADMGMRDTSHPMEMYGKHCSLWNSLSLNRLMWLWNYWPDWERFCLFGWLFFFVLFFSCFVLFLFLVTSLGRVGKTQGWTNYKIRKIWCSLHPYILYILWGVNTFFPVLFVLSL